MRVEQYEQLSRQWQTLSRQHQFCYDVIWCISYECHRDAWYFSCFRNYSDVKGNGAKALQEVCELADRYSIDLTLGCYHAKLFPYYERFGFTRTTHWAGPGWALYFRRRTTTNNTLAMEREHTAKIPPQTGGENV